MIKLLISDLDDTLYDWTGFFVPAFYAMADEIARMTGIDEKKLLNEYMAAHQRLGSVEYPYATLELPSIKAYYNNATAEELKAALRPAFNVFNSVRESHLHLLPGVEEMLRALTEMGVTLIAYTESSKENGFYRLMKLGIEPYFKHVYTFESQFKSAYAVSEKVRHGNARAAVRIGNGDYRRHGFALVLFHCLAALRKERLRYEYHLYAALGKPVYAPRRRHAVRFREHSKPRRLCKQHAVAVAYHGYFMEIIRHKASSSFPR